jgi:hypothetical protein
MIGTARVSKSPTRSPHHGTGPHVIGLHRYEDRYALLAEQTPQTLTRRHRTKAPHSFHTMPRRAGRFRLPRGSSSSTRRPGNTVAVGPYVSAICGHQNGSSGASLCPPGGHAARDHAVIKQPEPEDEKGSMTESASLSRPPRRASATVYGPKIFNNAATIENRIQDSPPSPEPPAHDKQPDGRMPDHQPRHPPCKPPAPSHLNPATTAIPTPHGPNHASPASTAPDVDMAT